MVQVETHAHRSSTSDERRSFHLSIVGASRVNPAVALLMEQPEHRRRWGVLLLPFCYSV